MLKRVKILKVPLAPDLGMYLLYFAASLQHIYGAWSIYFLILCRKCFQGLKVNNPVAKGKIGMDWFLNFILPGTDEITDLISGVRFFM